MNNYNHASRYTLARLVVLLIMYTRRVVSLQSFHYIRRPICCPKSFLHTATSAKIVAQNGLLAAHTLTHTYRYNTRYGFIRKAITDISKAFHFLFNLHIQSVLDGAAKKRAPRKGRGVRGQPERQQQQQQQTVAVCRTAAATELVHDRHHIIWAHYGPWMSRVESEHYRHCASHTVGGQFGHG